MTNNRLNVKGKFKEKQVNTKSSSPEQDMLKCDHLTQQKNGPRLWQRVMLVGKASYAV